MIIHVETSGKRISASVMPQVGSRIDIGSASPYSLLRLEFASEEKGFARLSLVGISGYIIAEWWLPKDLWRELPIPAGTELRISAIASEKPQDDE